MKDCWFLNLIFEVSGKTLKTFVFSPPSRIIARGRKTENEDSTQALDAAMKHLWKLFNSLSMFDLIWQRVEIIFIKYWPSKYPSDRCSRGLPWK